MTVPGHNGFYRDRTPPARERNHATLRQFEYVGSDNEFDRWYSAFDAIKAASSLDETRSDMLRKELLSIHKKVFQHVRTGC
jgi:hypothetical protein